MNLWVIWGRFADLHAIGDSMEYRCPVCLRLSDIKLPAGVHVRDCPECLTKLVVIAHDDTVRCRELRSVSAWAISHIEKSIAGTLESQEFVELILELESEKR